MKAYELLSSKEKWAKRAYAYDEKGAPCDPRDEKAVCFCLLGAIDRCYGKTPMRVRSKDIFLGVLEKLKNKVGNVPHWNDAEERTYEEVVAVLKELDI